MLFRVACLTLGALATADGFVVRTMVHAHHARQRPNFRAAHRAPAATTGVACLRCIHDPCAVLSRVLLGFSLSSSIRYGL